MTVSDAVSTTGSCRSTGSRRRRAVLPWAPVVALALLGPASCKQDDGGDLEAFCTTARGFVERNPAGVFDRYDPADPTAAAELLRSEAGRLRDWADDAPGEVDGDVEAIAAAAEALADGFESPAPSADRVAELEAQFEEVEDASARLTSYVREQCGVDLDPASNPAGTVVTSSTTTTAP